MDNRNFNGKEGKEIVPIMEEIINGGGQCKLRVTGYSMTPILKHLRDSVILTSPRINKKGRNSIYPKKNRRVCPSQSFKNYRRRNFYNEWRCPAVGRSCKKQPSHRCLL